MSSPRGRRIRSVFWPPSWAFRFSCVSRPAADASMGGDTGVGMIEVAQRNRVSSILRMVCGAAITAPSALVPPATAWPVRREPPRPAQVEIAESS
jgi:hypothetical protein